MFRILCILTSTLAAASAVFAPAAGAHEAPAAASAPAAADAPRRQADGSVFLPKPSQRQLAIRTVVGQVRTVPRTVELTGRVLMDPNAGGRVQPTQPGRIEAPAGGLPVPGQAVRRGQVLAVVRASASAIERANQQAQSSELAAQLALARRRVERLAQLEGTVPAKEIEAARAEAASLAQRHAAVSRSVQAAETLVAPVGGVIATANAVAGQVVDARELLFEIVDPARLAVEALAFDAALPAAIAGASASPAPGVSVPLRFVGAARAQREGALPLLFRTAGAGAPPLALNQPVKVVVQLQGGVPGVAVPAGAVVKNPSNQDIVWVHAAPEVFAPRAVRTAPLDGAGVSVVDGLAAGDRVVTQGAPLLNQVR